MSKALSFDLRLRVLNTSADGVLPSASASSAIHSHLRKLIAA